MTSWLITGGSGSFGKAFAKRLLADGASRVVILSRDELKQAEMAAEFNDPRLRFFIGSVCDAERVERAMHGVDHVVHAAAMKRVEACEKNPHEAGQVNAIGASVVSLMAIKAGIKKAVMLSTDKSVAANTFYGITKAYGEQTWCKNNVYAAGQVTRLSAVRYGNVIGSRGSVLHAWKAQAAKGGPLVVRAPEATRFWMTMDQAVGLVQLAFDYMRGGEIFLPVISGTTVGEFANIVAPGVPWDVQGLGPGEKMHEALISEDEVRHTYDHGDHYRIEPEDRPWSDALPVIAPRVPEGFTYRSDTCRMGADVLQRLVA